MKFKENKVVCAMACLLIVMAVFTIVFNEQKRCDYQDWVQTQGIVTQTKYHKNFLMIVYFDYISADGVQRSAKTSLRYQHEAVPAVGQRVDVWHDVADPSRAQLSKPELSALDYIAPVFITLPLIAAIILADRRRNA